MDGGKRLAAKKSRLLALLEYLGYTNCLGILLVLLILIGLIGGFVLAVLSIKYQYTGALACWTVVFTPIGTAISIVLARIVDKSRAENTGPAGRASSMRPLKPTTSQCRYRSRRAPWTARPSKANAPISVSGPRWGRFLFI